MGQNLRDLFSPWIHPLNPFKVISILNPSLAINTVTMLLTRHSHIAMRPELTYQERIFYTSGEFLWNQEVAHIPYILRQLSLAYSLVLYQSHIYNKPVEPLVIGNTTVSNTLHATIVIHSTYTNQHWERKGNQIDNAVIYLSRAMIILYAPCFLTSLCRAVSPSSSWAETSAPA